MIKISPVSEAKKRANKKWTDANYKRTTVSLPNDEMLLIDEYCKDHNISKNSFFRKLAIEKLSIEIEREK